MTSTALRPSTSRRHAPGVAPALLRRAMGHFATGVTVVTAVGPDGRPFGTTANSVTSVSLDPPLVLACLSHGSETLAAIRYAGRLGVGVLRADQRHLSDRFARRSDATTWLGVRHRVVEGVPLLEDALATLECDVHDELAGGDHAIVVGRVTGAVHVPDAGAPLLFFRGAYAGIDRAEAPAPPTAPTVALPSALGDLRMTPLGPDDEGGRVSVAVSVGEPRGVAGALLYVHRGCLLGDALGSAVCAGRERLRNALDLMGRDGPGVVVYHRADAGPGACCREGARDDGPTADEVAAVHRAVHLLDLHDVRLVGGAPDARALAEAGIRVRHLITPPHPRSTDVP